MRSANDRSTPELFDLKQCPGGIIDIEFIVQYYVLRYAHGHPDLAGPRNTFELLGAIEELALMKRDQSTRLKDAYRRYLDLDHGCKLAEQPPLLDDGELRGERRLVAEIWQRIFE